MSISLLIIFFFGIEERSSTPPNNTNDIDPSSQFGLDGTVNINELDVNPAEALEELPTEVIDVARLVEDNLCQQGDESEFIVTGTGGIAPSPNQVREVEVSEVDLVEPAIIEREAGNGERQFAPTEIEEAEQKIIEAQGWIINDRGVLELVAHRTNVHRLPPRFEDNNICHTSVK